MVLEGKMHARKGKGEVHEGPVFNGGGEVKENQPTGDPLCSEVLVRGGVTTRGLPGGLRERSLLDSLSGVLT